MPPVDVSTCGMTWHSILVAAAKRSCSRFVVPGCNIQHPCSDTVNGTWQKGAAVSDADQKQTKRAYASSFNGLPAQHRIKDMHNQR